MVMDFFGNGPHLKLGNLVPHVTTVSAEGIANGLSNIVNGGADFGVDTPNTVTYGIEEATLYAQTLAYNQDAGITAKVQLLQGQFIFSGPVNVNIVNGNNKIIYVGDGWERTAIGISDTFPSGNYLFEFGDSYTEDIIFKNIAFYNSLAAGTMAGVVNHLLASEYYSNVNFEYCYFEGNIGVVFNGIWGGHMIFDYCYVDPTFWNRLVSITYSTLSLSFTNCFITPYLTTGLVMAIPTNSQSGGYYTRSITFSNCLVTLNSTSSFLVYVASSTVVDLIVFENVTVLSTGSTNTTSGTYQGQLLNNAGTINVLSCSNIRFNYVSLVTPFVNSGIINIRRMHGIINHGGSNNINLAIRAAPITTPSIPALNTAVSNSTAENVVIYQTGGAGIEVNGVGIGSPNTIVLKIGDTITFVTTIPSSWMWLNI